MEHPLDGAFSGSGGREMAYEMATLGIRGGMPKLFSQIYEALFEHLKNKNEDFIIDKYVDPVDYSDQVSAMTQLLNFSTAARFGLTGSNTVHRMSAQYRDYIKYTVKQIESQRGVFRR